MSQQPPENSSHLPLSPQAQPEAGSPTGPHGASGSSDQPIEHPPESAEVNLEEVRRAQEVMQRWVELIERDGRYPLAAFRFLQEALEATVSDVHGENAMAETYQAQDGVDPHHVSGSMLCYGLRDHALNSYGCLAREVLRRWNICSTRDFGEMVFFLVEHDFLQKTADDRKSDFDAVFSFDEFDQYRINVSDLDVSDLELQPALAS